MSLFVKEVRCLCVPVTMLYCTEHSIPLLKTFLRAPRKYSFQPETSDSEIYLIMTSHTTGPNQKETRGTSIL